MVPYILDSRVRLQDDSHNFSMIRVLIPAYLVQSNLNNSTCFLLIEQVQFSFLNYVSAHIFVGYTNIISNLIQVTYFHMVVYGYFTYLIAECKCTITKLVFHICDYHICLEFWTLYRKNDLPYFMIRYSFPWITNSMGYSSLHSALFLCSSSLYNFFEMGDPSLCISRCTQHFIT